MATTAEIVAALTQNLDDMSTLADELIAFIVAADGVQADLRAQIETLVAADAALAVQVGAAFDKSEAVENKMREGLPGVPPVGGEPLLQSYPNAGAFDGAVAAYTGPEAVTLDGIEVRAGTAPSLDYFTHSATGEINTTGPTD
jgi:hypothetical protein